MSRSLNSSKRKSHENILFQGFVTLKERFIPTKNGVYPYYSVQTKPSSLIILAFHENHNLLITKEWRYAINEHVYSLPGGLLEEDESLLTGARRELLEETGYDAHNYEVLCECFPLPGLLEQTMSIIVATNLFRAQEPLLDHIEQIESIFMPISQFKEALFSQQGVDAMALAALGAFFLHQNRS